MFDSFDRPINYLRISVTDRCNLRCLYCMPPGGIPLLTHGEILRFEEIVDFVKIAVASGITKVRITGGEPLVRKGIVSLTEQLAAISGIQDLSLTTNGILLSQFAKPLAEAGLQRVNISLDAVDPIRYALITRGGDVNEVFRGIDAARNAGLLPVKINCVVQKHSAEPDALGVKEYCKENGLEVRFIRQMDLEKGEFSVVEGGSGGDCARCTRLRLTANGKLKPCLFSNIAFDIRELGYEEALRKAISNKPACGTGSSTHYFQNIGG